MKVDLHCHSDLSDGELSVEALIHRAADNQVSLLAITDHDVARLSSADFDLAESRGVNLIPGVEFSSQWSGVGIHVVGLAIDINAPGFQEALKIQRANRVERAREIARRLEKKGLVGVYEGATSLAGTSQIGRPHFARYLHQSGQVKNEAQAFKKYLGAGKVGDVKACWPSLEKVVGWIREAGGVAVLAHPAHYKISLSKLRCLCEDFRQAGGRAIEVVSGNQPGDTAAAIARLCQEFSFYGSCGSDFHGPASQWSDVGKMSFFPEGCNPVWKLWGDHKLGI